MFKRIFVLFVAVILVACGVVLAEQVPSSLSFDQTITSNTKMPNMNSKFYKKGDKIRMEMEMANGIKNVMIKTADKFYSVDLARGVAMAMPFSGEMQAKMSESLDKFDKTPEQFKEYIENNQMKKIGMDTVNGQLCDVYESSAVAGNNLKMWIAQNNTFPVRTEITTSEGKIVSDFKNVKINPSLDDSLFQIPAGVKVMDMSQMGSMMQNMQEMAKDPKFQENMKAMAEKFKNQYQDQQDQ